MKMGKWYKMINNKKCCIEKNLKLIDTHSVFEEIYECLKCKREYFVDVELVRDFDNLSRKMKDFN